MVSARTSADSKCVAAFTELLAIYIAEKYTNIATKKPDYHGGLPIARLHKVEDYVRAHLAGSISLEKLADLAELSLFHFSRVFKESTGMTPLQFVTRERNEPVGEIVAVGPAVTIRKTGDRVGVPWVQHTCGRCEWCARDKPSFCESALGTGVQMSGGHAEYMVAYADATMLLPGRLEYEQAAPLFCAGYTVWSGLRWAEPQPGGIHCRCRCWWSRASRGPVREGRWFQDHCHFAFSRQRQIDS
jgi:hypothetical protein